MSQCSMELWCNLCAYILGNLCFSSLPKGTAAWINEWMRKRRTHTKVHNSGYSTASLHNSDPNHRRSSGCLLPDIPACPVNTQTNMPLRHTRWIVDTLFKFTMVVFDMTLFESHFRKQSEVDNFQISKRFCSFEQQFQLSFVINYFNKGWTKHCKSSAGWNQNWNWISI